MTDRKPWQPSGPQAPHTYDPFERPMVWVRHGDGRWYEGWLRGWTRDSSGTFWWGNVEYWTPRHEIKTWPQDHIRPYVGEPGEGTAPDD